MADIIVVSFGIDIGLLILLTMQFFLPISTAAEEKSFEQSITWLGRAIVVSTTFFITLTLIFLITLI